MVKFNKKFPFLILRIVVGFLIIVFLFEKIPFNNVLVSIRRIKPLFLVFSFMVFFTPLIIGVKRWELFLKTSGMKTGFLHLSLPFFGGLFFNLFFPSVLAGDAFRTFSLFGRERSSSHILASVVLDRFSGLLALSSICISSFILHPLLLKRLDILFITLGFTFTILLSLFLLFKPYIFSLLEKISPARFKSKIRNLQEAFSFFKKKPGVFFKAFLYSLLIQVASITSVYLILYGLGVNKSFIKILGLIGIINFISMFPLTIAGLGLRDISSIYFLSLIGISKEISFSASLITFFFYSLMGIIGGIIYFTFCSRWFKYNRSLVSKTSESS